MRHEVLRLFYLVVDLLDSGAKFDPNRTMIFEVDKGV
jgi:hypothetical protein